jgi:hypothetical protein
MNAAVVSCPTFEDITASVRSTLCGRDNLDPEQTPLFRTPLLIAGVPCGVVFHIEGPRQLRTSAIWAAASDRIIFYDSTGARFHEVKLSESPSLAEAA